MGIIHAAGDAVLCGPQHRVIVIIAGEHIHEEVQHGVILHEGGFHIDLGSRLNKAIGAIAVVDDLNRVAVLVGNGDFV